MSAYPTNPIINLPMSKHGHSITFRWYDWLDILKAADDSPALANAIKQAETIYALIKEEKT
jgi:hypothetical protein